MSTRKYNESKHQLEERPTLERPEVTEADLQAFVIDEFSERVDNYEKHLESLHTLPCHESLKGRWKDGEEVKDETLETEDQFWEGTSWWPVKHLVNGKVKPGTQTRTIVIGIKSTPQQTERMFTLEEVLKIWEAGYDRGFFDNEYLGNNGEDNFNSLNQKDYFKQQFNISI